MFVTSPLFSSSKFIIHRVCDFVGFLVLSGIVSLTHLPGYVVSLKIETEKQLVINISYLIIQNKNTLWNKHINVVLSSQYV